MELPAADVGRQDEDPFAPAPSVLKILDSRDRDSSFDLLPGKGYGLDELQHGRAKEVQAGRGDSLAFCVILFRESGGEVAIQDPAARPCDAEYDARQRVTELCGGAAGQAPQDTRGTQKERALGAVAKVRALAHEEEVSGFRFQVSGKEKS